MLLARSSVFLSLLIKEFSTMLSPELLKILACPKCKGTIEHIASGNEAECLICRACKLRFPVIDEIPVMRLDKAEPLDNAAAGDKET